jgi:hypothetical protein
LHFTRQIIDNEGAPSKFYSWVHTSAAPKGISAPSSSDDSSGLVWLETATRAVFAALLKHNGLLDEAVSFSSLLSSKHSSLSTKFKPSPRMLTCIREALNIRTSIMREAQRIRLSPSQQTDSTLNPRELDKERLTLMRINSSDPARAKLAYRLAAKPVIAAAEFLLRIAPSVEIRLSVARPGLPRRPSLTSTSLNIQRIFSLSSSARSHNRNWRKLRTHLRIVSRFLQFSRDQVEFKTNGRPLKDVHKFLTASVSIPRIEELMNQKTEAASARLQALQRTSLMLSQLADSPVAKEQILLAFRQVILSSHILAGIDGAKHSVVQAIKQEFTQVYFRWLFSSLMSF